MAFCQVIFEAKVDNDVVAIGEQFTLEIITNQDCEIELRNDFGGLIILGGPYQSFMNSSSTVNGVTKSYKQTTFSYSLSAPKKGSYTIPAMTMDCNGETYKTKPITVKADEQSKVMKERLGDKAFFYSLETDKTSVFAGETFTVTFYLFTMEMPDELNAVVDGNAGDLWRGDITETGGSRNTRNVTQKTIKGDLYNVIELKKEVCRTVTPGILKIKPYYGLATKDIDFFTERRIEGYSNELEIQVKPLPGTPPDNFQNMIGDFELEHAISTTEVSQYQLFTLTLKISGSGNFSDLRNPILNLPESFQVEEPTISSNINFDKNGEKGFVEYEFMIRPKEFGTYKVRPFTMAYFDLASRTYKMISTEEFDIIVNEEMVTEVEGPESEHKNPVEAELTDIIHIKSSDSTRVDTNNFIFGSLPYWGGIGGPLLLSFVFIGIKKRKQNRSTEAIQQAEQKTAKRSIFKDLSQAKSLVASGNNSQGLKELKSGFSNYLMTQLGITMSGLSSQNVRNELSKRNVDDATISSYHKIWNKMEMAQYAPLSNENLQTLIEDTETFVKGLNKQL